MQTVSLDSHTEVPSWNRWRLVMHHFCFLFSTKLPNVLRFTCTFTVNKMDDIYPAILPAVQLNIIIMHIVLFSVVILLSFVAMTPDKSP